MSIKVGQSKEDVPVYQNGLLASIQLPVGKSEFAQNDLLQMLLNIKLCSLPF